MLVHFKEYQVVEIRLEPLHYGVSHIPSAALGHYTPHTSHER